MGGSSLAPAVLAASMQAAHPGIAVRVLDSTDPAAVACRDRSLGSRANAVPDRLQVRHDDRNRWPSWPTSGTSRTRSIPTSRRRCRPALCGHHGSQRRASTTSPTATCFARCSSTQPTLAAATARCRTSASCPARCWGSTCAHCSTRRRRWPQDCRAATRRPTPDWRLAWRSASLAEAGRDKLTLVIEPRSRALGAWIEQLIAESTGKQRRRHPAR